MVNVFGQSLTCRRPLDGFLVITLPSVGILVLVIYDAVVGEDVGGDGRQDDSPARLHELEATVLALDLSMESTLTGELVPCEA